MGNVLTTLIITLLLSNAVTSNTRYSIYYSRVAMIGLLHSLIILYSSTSFTALDKGISLYGGLFVVNSSSQMFILFAYLMTILILALTAFYPRKIISDNSLKVFFERISNKSINSYNTESYFKKEISNKIKNVRGGQFRIIEYALVITFVLCGAVFLMTSADLISIFLSIELQSYGLYILSTLYRDSEVSTGSGLTYFLLGGLSSCFILLGSALIYGITGITQLENLFIITNTWDNVYISASTLDSLNASHLSLSKGLSSSSLQEIYSINLSLIVLGVGFLFKVSAAPFHFWSPDVYDGIPTIVTTFVAIIAKISIFAFLLSFVFNNEANIFDFSWKYILLMSSLLSLIIGSLLGLSQFRIKRLYAYSTINHVGFILLALSIQSSESIQSYIFYILQYSISNLNAFVILITIGYSLFLQVNKNKQNLIDSNNSPVQIISQMKGYFYTNSFIAISLALTLFSFAGIPPTWGFFAKQMVLSAALDDNYVFIVIIAILSSVVGAGYYLNLVKTMFFYKSSNNLMTKWEEGGIEQDNVSYVKVSHDNVSRDNTKNNIISEDPTKDIKDMQYKWSINSSYSLIISVITLSLLLFMFEPATLMGIVNIISLHLFN